MRESLVIIVQFPPTNVAQLRLKTRISNITLSLTNCGPAHALQGDLQIKDCVGE